MPEIPETPEQGPPLIQEGPKRRPTQADSTPGGVAAPLGTETYETQPLPALDALLQTNFMEDLGVKGLKDLQPHAESHEPFGDDRVLAFGPLYLHDLQYNEYAKAGMIDADGKTVLFTVGAYNAALSFGLSLARNVTDRAGAFLDHFNSNLWDPVFMDITKSHTGTPGVQPDMDGGNVSRLDLREHDIIGVRRLEFQDSDNEAGNDICLQQRGDAAGAILEIVSNNDATQYSSPLYRRLRLADPVGADDATTKRYVDALSYAGHVLLDGSLHTDTLAGGVVDGDVIIGNVTPKWSRLAISVPAANVRNVLGIDNGELRPSWKTALDATAPANIANAASAGTSLIFAHRDHVHAHPAGLTSTLHHAKYTGAEAIAAVEAADPLALAGVVTIAKYFEFSEIALPSAPAASKGRLFAPLLTTNDSLTPGTDETGLFYRRSDGLMVKLSDDFPYSQKTRYVGQDDEPLFLNSWVNFEAGYRKASFVKDFLGCVWVRGLIKSGTIGANDIFALPGGYQNTSGSAMWATISNGALGRIDLIGGAPEAAVGNNAYASLARVAFPETSRIDWHEVGGGGEPAFENSWANYGLGWDVAGFAKDAIGRVWVKGFVKDGDDATAVFTLPAGYRPPEDIYLPIITATNVIGRMDILADGSVKVDLLGAGTHDWATINCVFQADGAITWHEVGSGGGEPAFESNWVNFGGVWGTAAFCKDAAGIVHIKGLVKDGDARPSVVFTLPVGYRPRGNEVAISLSADALGHLEVHSNGYVYAFAGSNVSFSIHFAFVAGQ